MKYKSFNKFITEKSAQSSAREFETFGNRASRSMARKHQECGQLTGDAKTACYYKQKDESYIMEAGPTIPMQSPDQAERTKGIDYLAQTMGVSKEEAEKFLDTQNAQGNNPYKAALRVQRQGTMDKLRADADLNKLDILGDQNKLRDYEAANRALDTTGNYATQQRYFGNAPTLNPDGSTNFLGGIGGGNEDKDAFNRKYGTDGTQSVDAMFNARTGEFNPVSGTKAALTSMLPLGVPTKIARYLPLGRFRPGFRAGGAPASSAGRGAATTAARETGDAAATTAARETGETAATTAAGPRSGRVRPQAGVEKLDDTAKAAGNTVSKVDGDIPLEPGTGVGTVSNQGGVVVKRPTPAPPVADDAAAAVAKETGETATKTPVTSGPGTRQTAGGGREVVTTTGPFGLGRKTSVNYGDDLARSTPDMAPGAGAGARTTARETGEAGARTTARETGEAGARTTARETGEAGARGKGRGTGAVDDAARGRTRTRGRVSPVPRRGFGGLLPRALAAGGVGAAIYGGYKGANAAIDAVSNMSDGGGGDGGGGDGSGGGTPASTAASRNKAGNDAMALADAEIARIAQRNKARKGYRGPASGINAATEQQIRRKYAARQAAKERDVGELPQSGYARSRGKSKVGYTPENIPADATPEQRQAIATRNLQASQRARNVNDFGREDPTQNQIADRTARSRNAADAFRSRRDAIASGAQEEEPGILSGIGNAVSGAATAGANLVAGDPRNATGSRTSGSGSARPTAAGQPTTQAQAGPPEPSAADKAEQARKKKVEADRAREEQRRKDEAAAARSKNSNAGYGSQDQQPTQ